MSKQYIKDLVSVVMPTYKRSEMLSRAVESVLNQTYKNIELIVVNDNEPDDDYTKSVQKRILKYIKDPRFKFVLQDKHVNGAVARNFGVEKSSGEYIAFLDDDDWWESKKIEHQVNVLSALPDEYGAVSCRWKRWQNGKVFELSPLYPNGNTWKEILCLTANYPTSTLLFRHEALDKAGYFDESLKRHQDLQLTADFTYRYKIYVVDEFLHNASADDGGNRPDAEKLKQVKKEFFKSVKPLIDSMIEDEQKQMFRMHEAEIGWIYLKNHQYISGISYFIKLLDSPAAFKLELKKYKDKKKSRKAAEFAT